MSAPPTVPETSVVVAPSPVPETTTSCTEEVQTTPAAYTPAPVPSSTSEKPVVPVPSSSSEKPVVPSSPAGYVPQAPPSSSAAYVPVKPSPEPSKEVPSYHPAPPASSSHVAPKPKPSKPSKPSAPSYGSGSWNKPNGNKWAITYTPYTAGGDCKSESEVQVDIGKISALGYTTIRVYSTDCGVFENVVPACQKHSLQVIYGIFLDANSSPGSEGANNQLNDIITKAPKDSVSMLIVGNEYISGHGGDAGALASYISTVRTQFRAAGFNAPVTTTETVAAWEQYGSAWCDVIDIFAAQVQPFFDGGKTASEAGQFAVDQLEQAAKICPEAAAKGKFISEIGWPAGGSSNNAAIPGKEEQKEAMSTIIEKVGDHACIFSYQNDDWKAPGAYNVEQYFGCADNL